MLVRIKDPDAHVDNPTWREILTFLALRRLVNQIFEGVVDHVEIGIKQLPFFQRSHADLQVIRRELDAVVLRKDAGPLLTGVVEQSLNGGLELRGGVAVAESQMLVRSAVAGHFVVKLCENQLEDFFEDVHASVC
jgi:hypothetical protein